MAADDEWGAFLRSVAQKGDEGSSASATDVDSDRHHTKALPPPAYLGPGILGSLPPRPRL